MTDTLPQPQSFFDVVELIERYEERNDIFGDISLAYEAVVEDVYDIAGMTVEQLVALYQSMSDNKRYSPCIAAIVVINMQKAGFKIPASPDNTATCVL